MTPKENYNLLLSQKLIENFQKRNMEAYYSKTKEEALKKVLEIISENSLVSCGGSYTLNEIGIIDKLKSGNYNFLDPNSAFEVTDKEKIAHEALAADYFLMSTNAISETGELVNIDGIGNRVSALIFGPKHVVIIASLNKVEPSLDAAILRAKTYASRLILLNYKSDYKSFDELSMGAEGAGSNLVITSMSVFKERIKIILVGEDLGF